MVTAEEFHSCFSNELLKQQFEDKIRYRCSSGVDKIGINSFVDTLDSQVATIARKVTNGTYKFTKYDELLVSKGRNKPPRVISRPSIRDKLTLSVIHRFLQSAYHDEIDSRLIHSKINEISTKINTYTHFIKIDIKGFYSNINHELLLKKLSEKLPGPAIEIIKKAIETPTIAKIHNSKVTEVNKPEKGVPEGLSISNILADIYLLDLDSYFGSITSIHYCRFVDDILILCKNKNVDNINREIANWLNDLSLELNQDKFKAGDVYEGFGYLGYYFDGSKIGIRDISIDRFEHSIEKLFSDYNHHKFGFKLFEWKLNLKITGCVCENRKYGWLFYYSQIDDITLLKKLDWLVSKLIKRFKIVDNNLYVKSFLRNYHEIKHNLHNSDYFICIDKLSIAEKSHIIQSIYGKIPPPDEHQINDLFSQLIRRDLLDLEKDIQFFS